MKRILSLFLALMLMACASALAEPTRFEDYGFAIDFSDIQAKSACYPVLMEYGIVQQEPYVAVMDVFFYSMHKDVVETIVNIIGTTEDPSEREEYSALLRGYCSTIAEIIVTDAPKLDNADPDITISEDCEVVEFGTLGDYHFHLLTFPKDDQIDVYDEADGEGEGDAAPQALKAATLADIQMVQSELLRQLQASELFEPVNTEKAFVGQTISFESVDLDGNAMKSADLFRDNKITMVNIWGTWCGNCINEMDELAVLHKRFQEKGCGIVGVEYESAPIENVADEAREIFQEYGITYPNVIMPKDDPFFDQVVYYPTTFFVDSEGKIITYPITGAAVSKYEPTLEKLLAGETIEDSPSGGAAANDSGEYRVFVYDTQGNPVKGAIVQMCDEESCTFQKTKADGMAVFQVEAPKVFDVHLGKVPEGYVMSDETYKTLDTYSDVNIFISKAE